MALARYTVNLAGVPAPAIPALTPEMPRSPASTFWGGANITGHPGTMAVPAPKPGVWSVGPDPRTQGSYNAPDHIRPSLYYSTPDPQWWFTPIDETGNNPDPVPATALYYVGGIAARTARQGGQWQVAQPQTAQTFPDLLTGANAAYSGVVSRFGSNPLTGS